MNLILKLMVSLVISTFLGLGSAIWAITYFPARTSQVANGAWHTSLAFGSSEADWYTRALVAHSGLFALNKSDAGVNTLLHAPRVTVDSRDVVKPSPDLLYSLCVYDVSAKPLRITAPVPDTYWSISFYQTNTDNFFVLNDRQAKANPVEIVLVGPDMPVPDTADAEVVVAPTTKGIFLLRSLIIDEGKLDDLIKIQRMASCKSS